MVPGQNGQNPPQNTQPIEQGNGSANANTFRDQVKAKLKLDVTCIVTTDIFKHPVILKCGGQHTLERAAAEKIKKSSKPCCPTCNGNINFEDSFERDRNKENLVETFLALFPEEKVNLYNEEETPSGQNQSESKSTPSQDPQDLSAPYENPDEQERAEQEAIEALIQAEQANRAASPSNDAKQNNAQTVNNGGASSVPNTAEQKTGSSNATSALHYSRSPVPVSNGINGLGGQTPLATSQSNRLPADDKQTVQVFPNPIGRQLASIAGVLEHAQRVHVANNANRPSTVIINLPGYVLVTGNPIKQGGVKVTLHGASDIDKAAFYTFITGAAFGAPGADFCNFKPSFPNNPERQNSVPHTFRIWGNPNAKPGAAIDLFPYQDTNLIFCFGQNPDFPGLYDKMGSSIYQCQVYKLERKWNHVTLDRVVPHQCEQLLKENPFTYWFSPLGVLKEDIGVYIGDLFYQVANKLPKTAAASSNSPPNVPTPSDRPSRQSTSDPSKCCVM